jgi:acid phosphatase
MGRHGSRYPLASELVYITNLTAKLTTHSSEIARASLPKELAFLKDGYTSTLGANDLTAAGRRQLFDHGVAWVMMTSRSTRGSCELLTSRSCSFRLKYPKLNGTTILAGLQDRVVESAQWFAQGYFGRIWPNISATAFSTIPEDNVTISFVFSRLLNASAIEDVAYITKFLQVDYAYGYLQKLEIWLW